VKTKSSGCVLAGFALFLHCASSRAVDDETKGLASAAAGVAAVKLAPPVPPAGDYAAPFARSMDEAHAGDYRGAIVDAQRSLALAEQRLGADSKIVGDIAHVTATYQILDSQPDKARPLLERELRITGRPAMPKDVDLALAQTLAETGRAMQFAEPPKPEQATPLLQQALSINEKVRGRDDPYVAASAFDLAGNYALQNKYAEAEPLYLRALAVFEKLPSAENAITVCNDLASMYIKERRYRDAEPLLRRALALLQKQDEPDGSLGAEVRRNLAQVYRETGRATEANALAPMPSESPSGKPD
jgi:tetratricopeptide (TPR) repeat protein